jgi:Raf kinase inhibitor-like YbhB/YbcL family protein
MKLHLVAAAAAFFAFVQTPAFAADVFQVTSPAFVEGAVLAPSVLATVKAGDGTPCGGQNILPALTWRNAPADTKSFALLVIDPDGALGLGASHLVAYDIAPTVTSLPEGVTEKPNPPLTFGTNIAGERAFRGFCPPRPSSFHHYVFQIFALDLPPTFPPGLTRVEFLAAIDKHILRETSISGLIKR